jgi:CHAT domain-containing protein
LNDKFQAIVLSQIPEDHEDGYLTLGKIMNSRYNAHLVVLSACDTGLGRIERGEGVTGLTRAVMYAGTPAAIVSLWSVSDEGTKELMTSFYKNLIKKRMSKDEALRQAKIEMIGRKDNDSKMEKASDETLRSVKITGRSKSLTYSHPFFWSAFVMYGE